LALTFLLSLIPFIAIVTYFHGLPGRNKWHRAEIVAIPLNLVAMMVLALLLFSGKDLGATQKKMKASDEAGNVVERIVPKSQFRKKIALFSSKTAAAPRKTTGCSTPCPTCWRSTSPRTCTSRPPRRGRGT
jgi:hypothetical protein